MGAGTDFISSGYSAVRRTTTTCSPVPTKMRKTFDDYNVNIQRDPKSDGGLRPAVREETLSPSVTKAARALQAVCRNGTTADYR